MGDGFGVSMSGVKACVEGITGDLHGDWFPLGDGDDTRPVFPPPPLHWWSLFTTKKYTKITAYDIFI